jgi:Transposase DDE domain group 1
VKKSHSITDARLYTPRATLCAIGLKIRSLKLFDTVAEHVHIRQKTIRHTPIEKLQDAFMAILSGAHGLVEVNTRVRTDTALQRAFGRTACAEQSVVQETLSACTAENVVEMEEAVDALFRAHSQTFRHNYKKGSLLLDIDLTGMPCGGRAEMALKGYFSQAGVRYGRQMGRVVAARYDEVVVDRLYPGNLQLRDTLPHLVEAMEKTLLLDEAKRRQTVLRIDAGGGSMNGINWLLERGYHVHCKDFSSRRAAHYALSVKEWVDDPSHRGRQLGWAIVKSGDYARPVKRLAVRWRKRNGQKCHALLISTLEPEEVMELLGEPLKQASEAHMVLLAYARLYDERGGAIEIDIKESKQGLGIAKRNKKSYTGQQMVMLLGQLAHNVMVWVKRWLLSDAPKLKKYGVRRMVRDVMTVSGFVEVGKNDAIKRVLLNSASAVARQCAAALRALLKREQVRVILGET